MTLLVLAVLVVVAVVGRWELVSTSPSEPPPWSSAATGCPGRSGWPAGRGGDLPSPKSRAPRTTLGGESCTPRWRIPRITGRQRGATQAFDRPIDCHGRFRGTRDNGGVLELVATLHATTLSNWRSHSRSDHSLRLLPRRQMQLAPGHDASGRVPVSSASSCMGMSRTRVRKVSRAPDGRSRLRRRAGLLSRTSS